MKTREPDLWRRSLRRRISAPTWWLLLTVACIAPAAPAGAETAWVGVQLHLPVPARDVGDSQLGADAGVTFTQMQSRYFGLGVDVIHHYWPASAEYETEFDRYLRSTRMEALEGSGWALTALQLTAHVRLASSPVGRFTPWGQVGGGLYRLNLNLDERRPEGTYMWAEGPSVRNVYYVGGGYGSIGIDAPVSSRVVLGVDATLHLLKTHHGSEFYWIESNDMPDFSAFTIGTHVMFGW